jgi:phosphoribosylformylglycinamidine cyclo-ligase
VGKRDPDLIELILRGISAGCRKAGCALLGGETSELPGFYPAGRYELSGFAVGVVERSKLLSPARICEGDEVLGLASSGLHAHGYSLVRKVLSGSRKWSLTQQPPGLRRTLGEELLLPTRCYARPVLAVLGGYRRKQVIRSLAHVAGGGLTGSFSAALPPGFDIVLDAGDWPVPPIFRLIQEAGKVSPEEMYRVFNMGIGMGIVVSPHFTDSILKQLAGLDCPAWRIGRVVSGRNRVLVR